MIELLEILNTDNFDFIIFFMQRLENYELTASNKKEIYFKNINTNQKIKIEL